MQVVRIGLQVSEAAAQQFIELAGGERNRSEWLEETITKLSSGWRMVPPDMASGGELEAIDARLAQIEATLKRMALEK